MKKYILIPLLLILVNLVFAQRPAGGNNQKIESMRVAYITERLQLSPQEAQRFWPVYNAYKAELRALRQSFRMEGDPDEPVNASNQLEFEQGKLNIKKKFMPQFVAAIGQEKVNLLMRAEEEFKRKLVEQLKGGRQ